MKLIVNPGVNTLFYASFSTCEISNHIAEFTNYMNGDSDDTLLAHDITLFNAPQSIFLENSSSGILSVYE